MEADEVSQPDRPDEEALASAKLVEGQVAKVLNERELVINRGREDGVREGMHFKVLAKETLKILDPASGVLLGELEQDKVRVEATRVLDRMTVCRTYISWTVGGEFTIQDQVRSMFRPPQRVYETLSAEKEAFPAPLSQDESYVKVGDWVRQLLPSEENTVVEES